MKKTARGLVLENFSVVYDGDDDDDDDDGADDAVLCLGFLVMWCGVVW